MQYSLWAVNWAFIIKFVYYPLLFFTTVLLGTWFGMDRIYFLGLWNFSLIGLADVTDFPRIFLLGMLSCYAFLYFFLHYLISFGFFGLVRTVSLIVVTPVPDIILIGLLFGS
jgi:xanthine/uracil permease